jgi:hypothetical protein
VTIPKFDELLRPILALTQTSTISRVSATEAMTKHFQLDTEATLARIPSGKSTYIRNRTGWAMTFLTKAKLIEKVAKATYGLTERGRLFLETHPDAISRDDLRAIEGWQEAWAGNADDPDEAPDETDDNPEVVQDRIRAKVAKAIPNPAARQAVLGFLAYAVENADEERPDAWSIREARRGLDLKVGRVLAFRIHPNAIGVSIIGPLSEQLRNALGAREEEVEAWKWIPDGVYVSFQAERAAAAFELLKDPYAKFVDAAVARVRRGVDIDDHCAPAIAYLAKEVGTQLPQPDAARAADDDQTSPGDDDGQVPGQTLIRGRAPIFEYGQRAIGSLIEDVNPGHGVIALPDLQRPFVWDDTQVRELLDSLFIGFPVGTLVLWHTSDQSDAHVFGSSDRAVRATILVIDGQQRLTSLFAVMRGQHIVDKDGIRRQIRIAFRPRDGRFDVADAAIAKDPEYIESVTELWSGHRTVVQIRRDLIKSLSERGRLVDDEYEEAVDTNLARAQAIRDYRFPTVEIRKTAAVQDVSEEDVADIFVRINSQGKRLGQADFVLTLLSVSRRELRDRIESRASALSTNSVVPVDTQQILRAACAVGFGRARMSAVYKFLRGLDPNTRDASQEHREQRLTLLEQATDACLNATTWRDYMLRVVHAGFVSEGLIPSTSAVVNAYAIYVQGRQRGVPKNRLDEAVSRWLFGTLLTARYSSSSESKFEEDLARLREVEFENQDLWLTVLDGLLVDILTDDYWTRTLPSALETQRGRAPAALAFRAAQVVLGAKALFGDQLLQHLIAPPAKGGRAASEMHHLFPKAWLARQGLIDKRRVNQIANLADVGWHENGAAGGEGPALYVPRLRDRLNIDESRWGRMCAEHALPIGWESMAYDDFLTSRRPKMAEVIRIAFRKLGGESDASPLTPPWFLPGAEIVWARIGETERALRQLVKSVYKQQFGDRAGGALQAAFGPDYRDTVAKASRNVQLADPLTALDYLYLGQLPALLFRSDVWPVAREALGGRSDSKAKLEQAIQQIAPVRNEIAHVREVMPDRLQRANLACADVLAMVTANPNR